MIKFKEKIGQVTWTWKIFGTDTVFIVLCTGW